MDHDERSMNRALDLAAEVRFTSPNPKVGSVVVKDGQIIGEGAHRGAGHPHAEPVALADIDARGATLYVNLEPCVHHGRMPPCVPTIVAAGIERVVVAIEDPDPRVAGRGITALLEAGIRVDVGTGAERARSLNRSYLHHRALGRPFVTLKMAMSLDGKLAAADRSSRWITGDVTRTRVHRQRETSDAVVVGAGTVLADDPSLTARAEGAIRQPARVVCDSSGRVPPTAGIFATPGTIVMTTSAASHDVVTGWKEAGAEVVTLPAAEGRVDLAAMMANLGVRGWLEVYCEGGAQLGTSLLVADLVDRLEIHYGPLLLGVHGVGLGDLGVGTMERAPRWATVEVTRSGDDAVVAVERIR